MHRRGFSFDVHDFPASLLIPLGVTIHTLDRKPAVLKQLTHPPRQQRSTARLRAHHPEHGRIPDSPRDTELAGAAVRLVFRVIDLARIPRGLVAFSSLDDYNILRPVRRSLGRLPVGISI